MRLSDKEKQALRMKAALAMLSYTIKKEAARWDLDLKKLVKKLKK